MSSQNSKLAARQILSVGQPLAGTAFDLNSILWTGATGTTPPNGWAAGNTGTYSVVDGGNGHTTSLKIARVSTGPYCTNSFTTVVGVVYNVSISLANVDATDVKIGIGTSNTNDNIISLTHTSTSWTNYQRVFVAVGTTTHIYIQTNGPSGTVYGYIDDIIIRPIHASALTLPQPAFNLTNTSAIPTYGHKGNNSYYSFNGTSQYINLGTSASLDPGTGNFSITIRAKTSSSAEQSLYQNYDVTTNDGILFFLTSSGNLRGHIYENGTLKYVLSSGTYNDGIVHSFCFNIDRTSATGLKLYVDGIQCSYTTQEDPTSLTGNIASTGPKYLGVAWGGSNYPFNGSISSLQIFNYALDQTGVTYYSNPANHLRAVDQGATGAVLTSGTLVVGKSYIITNWITNDDFTNVGGANVDGTVFTATGTTPTTWTNSSTVVMQGSVLTLNSEGMLGSPTQGIWRDAYHSVDIALSGTTAPRLYKQELGAWRFNGTSSYLSKTSSGLTQAIGSSDRTISCWVFPIKFQTSFILWYGTHSSHARFYLSVNTSGFTIIGDGDADASPNPTSAMTINAWNHIVAVYSGGVVKYYLNGAANGTSTLASVNTVDGNIKVGVYYNDTLYFFDGIIEGLCLYHRAFSAEDVLLDYQAYQD